MRALLLFLAAVPSVALSAERIRMTDNSNQTSIKDTLESVCGAFDSENLDAFESCFAKGKRSQIRRKYAMTFVSDRCSMELLEHHTIKVDGDRAEAAVRYKMGGSSFSQEVVSKVDFVKEDGRWLIEKETLLSKRHSPPTTQASVASARPEPNDDNWDPMNPDPTRVSPNLQHLIGDIGIRPGMGCAGGACANGRCPVQ